ncbi:GIY-YIG nuclease family protein [Crocosphaera watsonii WH 8501]|nr:GIY-YIG nuclease family protein [Crocosphaera sp.]
MIKITRTSQSKVIYIGQSKNIYKRWKNGHALTLGKLLMLKYLTV